MLKVFVCEDEDVQRKRLTKIIEEIILTESYDMKISLSSTKPEDIIDYVSKNSGTGLYFLDIDLNSHINGIQLASEIRKYDSTGFIVFISSHSDMSYLIFKYKVEAMDYIEKRIFDDFPDKIRQCIVEANRRYVSRTSMNSQTKYIFKTEDRLISVELEKILFFKTATIKNRIELYGLNCFYDFNGNLKDIEDEFQGKFYRYHKSYLVNKDNIKEINLKKKVIYMVDGQECPISVRQSLKLMKSNLI